MAEPGPPTGAGILGRGLELHEAFRLRGAVVEVGDGVAGVAGLDDVGEGELVGFASGAVGMAVELAPERTGVVLLSETEGVCAGDGVEALGRLPSLPVSGEVLGRVLDPLGRPLDSRPEPAGEPRAVFREAPALTERAAVDRPLLTGIMVIDAAIPIGRGQRQLILGDRNVGKTALGLDIVAAQRAGDVVCVYVIIGQPISRVMSVRADLERSGALANTVVVAAEAADPPGLQYLAPYSGATIAEYFRDQGRDALVVYDDLTKHADAYRELALLLGRPPGREAFPGDIFYIHAELLERATTLCEAAGGGSVSAFPIVETTDSDISAYIPTNLISITDGQIYLDAARFERNQRPAVDIGRSVSRVGGVAQPPVIRQAARNLRITMSQFEALEALTRVGLDVDPETTRAVARGRIVREILRQPRFTVRSVAHQLFALTALAEGWLESLGLADVPRVLWSAAQSMDAELAEATARINAGEPVPAEWMPRARALVERLAERAG
ncbi:MAG: F0F1 ATP synthase subunit alpha [Gammaproteobacteria bacterium]